MKTNSVQAAKVKAKTKDKHGQGSKKYNLFVYGTLLSDHHVRMLLHRKVEHEQARLNNYMKITPKGAFFFIIRHTGSKTNGRVLKNLSEEEIKLIDRFEDEGNLYFRKNIIVNIGDERVRCMTYVGNIQALHETFGEQMKFEDRYAMFIEKKIDEILDDIPTDRPDITRRVLNELMSLEADSIVQSHFDGNYICEYIMIQAFKEARPPNLKKLLESKEILPYAGNYMRLACQHIVFNQFVELIRHEFHDAVRVSEQYFRHGLAILLGFLFYNKNKEAIDRLFDEAKLHEILEGRSYRDSAVIAVGIVDKIYNHAQIQEIIDYVEENWYSTPTPIGAELEFSCLGKNVVYAKPGEDKLFDGFFWFDDFDMQRRTWRLGGHIDSHRNITAGQKRHRGFFEYALGRYQIVGDLSRPLFDCPWALSKVINEAVKFLDIPPHSLHLSMELSGSHSHVTDQPHKEGDLACLLMLGGDFRLDSKGKLREWRVYNDELSTNFKQSLRFSDRKYHFSKPDQDESEAAETMEYKFMRLFPEEHDYEKLIVALKGYQFKTHARPICIAQKSDEEMPEQKFIKEWGANPEPLDSHQLITFVETVERGLLEENNSCKLEKRKMKMLEKIQKELFARNNILKEHSSQT